MMAQHRAGRVGRGLVHGRPPERGDWILGLVATGVALGQGHQFAMLGRADQMKGEWRCGNRPRLPRTLVKMKRTKSNPGERKPTR